MRLLHTGGAAAILCAAVLAACSDQPSAPGGAPSLAEGARLRLHGSASLAIHTPRGIETRALPPWTASGAVLGGVARDESAASPLGVLGVASAMRGELGPRGGSRAATFSDDAGKRHVVVWVFAADGGPVRAVGHFIDGMIADAREYEWRHAGNGFTLAASRHSTFRDGRILMQVDGAAAGAPEIAARGISREAFDALARAAVRTLAPREAHAQILSGKCRREWLEYVAATAALAAADIALVTNPENPALYFLWLAAATKATNAEMALYTCQLRNGLLIDPPITQGGFGGSSGGGTGIDPVVCQLIPTMPGCPQDPARTQ